MIGVMVDWSQVLIVGVPAYIAAIGAAVASIIAAVNRRSLQTPSGDPIGHVVERAHETSIANNLLLRATNGESRPAKSGELKAASAQQPNVPVDGG